jgi:hypothetical protein
LAGAAWLAWFIAAGLLNRIVSFRHLAAVGGGPPAWFVHLPSCTLQNASDSQIPNQFTS